MDDAKALHMLAKLMPWLTADRSLHDILHAINTTFGAAMSWVVVDDDAGRQLVSCGEIPCTLEDVEGFLGNAQMRRHYQAWRVICWRSNVGVRLFPQASETASQLQSGILCKLNTKNPTLNGYFFLALSRPLPSMVVLKNIVVILVEKLKDYLGEIMARERMALEMQRVVTQYKILFDRAPVLMNSFDKHNRCVLWNGECERLFGWRIDELNQHADPLALFYPDPEVRRQMRASVNTSPMVDMQEWHPVRRDGAVLTVLWSNILLPDNSILNIGLDITERKKAEQQLALKATTDDLTGCLNRFAILLRLKDALVASAAGCHHQRFSVVMFDLDHFKRINDSWGHQAGDMALTWFCDRIRELSPQGYQLGRLGGEEFLMIMPLTGSQTAVRFTQKLRAVLSDEPLLVGKERLKLSFSAGVVSVTNGEVESSALLTLADNALYDAKRAGRGKTIVAAELF